ncbi:MAG: hypothetical protein K5686_09780 [Lachnospiraceae bacterium]|nr:hypothetical protein [Lachnospiraceae bacterium]
MKAKRVIAMLMSLSLLASMSACGKETESMPAQSRNEEIEEEAKLSGLMAEAVGSHSSDAGKDEVVYVLMDADGKEENVIVSDQLKNAGGNAKLSDMTELKDISNVNGYGSYEKNEDGTITWEADGSDIFYHGTTDKELPVEVKLSYELDGQKISAKDLAGKDGHVKIRLDYENRSKENVDVDGNEYEVNVPFVMVSGMILPDDTFSNVSVTNGKVIGEGNNEIVLGLAYPGLKESLDWDNTVAKAKDDEAREKLEEINIPDYVEIEADAHDFELGMTMTLAGCDIFNQVDASDSVDLSGIQEKMDELGNGSKELVDGSAELKNGTAELKNGTTDLKKGTADLWNGTADLKKGTADLWNGTADLKNGTAELKSGTGDLKSGTAELKDGTGKLYQGAGDLKDGSSRLKNGAGELKNGSSELYEGSKTLKNGTEELYNGTKSLKEGAAGLYAGSGSLYDGIVSYTDGALQISAGARQLAGGAAVAKNGADTLAAGFAENDIVGNANALAEGASQISAGIDMLNEALAGSTNASVSKLRGAAALTSAAAEWMQGNLASLQAGGEIMGSDELAAQSEALTGAVSLTYEQCYGALQLAAGGDSTEAVKALTACKTAAALYGSVATELESAMASVPEQMTPLKNGADQLAGGAAQLAGGLKNVGDGVAKLDAGLNELSQGAAALSSGADGLVQNNDALVKGAADLKEGAGRLDEGAGSVMNGAGRIFEGAGDLTAGAGKLVEGSSSLYEGAAQLDAGAGSLKAGVAKVDEGAGRLNDGAGKLFEGAGKLDDGAFKLYDGAGRLNDGAGRLYEGAGKLDDGAGRLTEGAAKLDEGAAALRDGMIRLDEEGIQKVTELLGDDATEILNRFKAVRKAGENYTSFTGALDEDGDANSVRFVYKTGAVK